MLQAEVPREPEWQEVAAPQPRHIQQQQRLSALQRRAASSASTSSEPFPALPHTSAAPSSSQQPPLAAATARQLPSPAASSATAFPPLPAAPKQAGARPALWGAPAPSAAKSGGAASQQPAPLRSREEDFPVLGQRGPAAAPAAPQPSAVSDSIKAANKVRQHLCRRAVTPLMNLPSRAVLPCAAHNVAEFCGVRTDGLVLWRMR